MYKWIFCFLCVSLLADKAPVVLDERTEQLPWLTGPLIAPAALVLKWGQINFEPYIFATANTGVYNSDWHTEKIPTLWNLNLAPLVYFGMNDFIDLTLLASVFYNICENQRNWALGDLNFGIEFQLLEYDYYKHDWYPNIKFAISENFPIGKYDNLNPDKRGTQIGGNGSYETQFQLLFGKLVKMSQGHYFSGRLVLTYILPAPVTVRGFNSYGGGYGAHAKVYPAQLFEVDLGYEFCLSKNWVLAGDIIGIWQKSNRFKGFAGVDVNGMPGKIGPGSSFQFSLAPALEYNWNANIGLVFGLWFTAAGRNAPQFYSGVVAFNYFK